LNAPFANGKISCGVNGQIITNIIELFILLGVSWKEIRCNIKKNNMAGKFDNNRYKLLAKGAAPVQNSIFLVQGCRCFYT
jgi:hypothetical protein